MPAVRRRRKRTEQHGAEKCNSFSVLSDTASVWAISGGFLICANRTEVVSVSRVDRDNRDAQARSCKLLNVRENDDLIGIYS